MANQGEREGEKIPLRKISDSCDDCVGHFHGAQRRCAAVAHDVGGAQTVVQRGVDGVFDAVEKGYLLESAVYDFLSNAPNNLDVICTGVEVSDKFLPLFSMVTELSDKTVII